MDQAVLNKPLLQRSGKDGERGFPALLHQFVAGRIHVLLDLSFRRRLLVENFRTTPVRSV